MIHVITLSFLVFLIINLLEYINVKEYGEIQDEIQENA